ncbi:MAG TPA: pseudouridine-5'-phosphate glycosidase [Blastocatellia bacterium]|jgi:pseudouridine-5'-phosphate glycosidase|nr:pseudouridine-5'-phosphate glycosidase [Blastocatellia bacterium]
MMIPKNRGRTTDSVKTAPGVARALEAGAPAVALESTVIAYGLPRPLNLQTARACEEAVREAGAAPATVGIVEGVPVVGLDEAEIIAFAEGVSPDGRPIAKVSLNNLAAVIAGRGWGATTVAGTLRVASLAGLRVFATGGIGGVHRGAADSLDVSADLTALASIPLVCVCAGAKAILDLPKTVEYLETSGVPVLGYGSDEFPAFYSRASGLPVDYRVETPDEAAAVAARHWETGGAGAVLVCVPIPSEFELAMEEVERAVDAAMASAATAKVRGKAITPFLLSQMEKLTGGNTLEANRALLVNNARVAGRISASLARLL